MKNNKNDALTLLSSWLGFTCVSSSCLATVTWGELGDRKKPKRGYL